MDVANDDADEDWQSDCFVTQDCASTARHQASSSRAVLSGAGRHDVILHVDIDSFYCEVERMDDPSLRGRPLVVQQFNSGGFVAVSYEAKAFGIRKGDGVGAAGRSNIQTLIDMKAVSLAEAKQKCPGLVVRAMRTPRYREVALQIQNLLRPWAQSGVVEKASYDDFYLCLDRTAAKQGLQGAIEVPGGVHLVGSPSLAALPLDLAAGCAAGLAAQDAIRQLGLSASIGVSRTKLLSRLASPLHKPSAVTVVADAGALHFLHSQPLRCVPGFQGKLGKAVAEQLKVHTVRDLCRFDRRELAGRFGVKDGNMLADLAAGNIAGEVRERSRPKTIISERSCPPTSNEPAILGIVRMLSQALSERLVSDAAINKRIPSHLTVHWRQGYAADPGVRRRSVPFPVASSSALMASLIGGRPLSSQDGYGGLVDALCSASFALFKRHAAEPWEVTRMVVGVGFHTGKDKQGSATAQMPAGAIRGFLQPADQSQNARGALQSSPRHPLQADTPAGSFLAGGKLPSRSDPDQSQGNWQPCTPADTAILGGQTISGSHCSPNSVFPPEQNADLVHPCSCSGGPGYEDPKLAASSSSPTGADVQNCQFPDGMACDAVAHSKSSSFVTQASTIISEAGPAQSLDILPCLSPGSSMVNKMGPRDPSSLLLRSKICAPAGHRDPSLVCLDDIDVEQQRQILQDIKRQGASPRSSSGHSAANRDLEDAPLATSRKKAGKKRQASERKLAGEALSSRQRRIDKIFPRKC